MSLFQYRPLHSRVNQALFTVFVAFLFLVSLVPQAAYAQPDSLSRNTVLAQDENPCHGLDIIFLYSDTYGMKYNDKLLQRREAMWTAVDMLTDNLIYFCPDYQHRISIIGFGDTEYVSDEQDYRSYVSDYPINPTLGNLGKWNTMIWDEVKYLIPDVRGVPEFGKYLNFEAALIAASDQLTQWQQKPPDTLARQRALVILSDGNMCNYDGCDLVGEGAKMRKYTDPNGQYLPWHGKDSNDSVSIFHIGFFSSESGTPDFFRTTQVGPFWEQVTADHGGTLELLQISGDNSVANADVSQKLALAMNNLLGSQLNNLDCNQSFWVDPYVNSITVVRIFRIGANENIQPADVKVRIVGMQGASTLIDIVDGKKVVDAPGMDMDYYRSDQGTGLNERYVLVSPPPGEYKVIAEDADICRDVKVQTGQSSVGVKVISPTTETLLTEDYVTSSEDAQSPYVFKVALTRPMANGGLVPLQEIADYPIENMKVTISGPGPTYSYDMVLINEAEAIYGAVDPKTKQPQFIQTAAPGEYTWTLTAETKDPRNGSNLLRIINTTGNFSVTAITRPFTFSFTKPKGTEDVHLADNASKESIELTFQVTNPDGTPLPKGLKIAPEGVVPFNVTLITPEGNTPADSVELKEDGQYHATVTRSGGFVEGQYILRIELIDSYDRVFIPQITTLEQPVSFTRSPFDMVFASLPQGSDLRYPENQPLNEFEVRMELQQAGQLLLAKLVGKPGDEFVTMALKDDLGAVLDQVTLPYNDTNVFSPVLKNKNGFVDGKCYSLSAELINGNYDSRLFNPNKASGKQQFCINQTRLLEWAIVRPQKNQSYPIHPTLKWFPPPNPRDIAVKVSYTMQDKGQVNADALQAGSTGMLFTGELVEIQSGIPYPITFEADKSSGLFISPWPEAASRQGKYKVTVDMNAAGIPQDFMLSTETTHTEHTFQLKDNLFSNPWSLLALIILSAYVLVAWIILRFLTSGKLLGVFLECDQAQLPLWGKFNRRKHVLLVKEIQKIFGITIVSITARQASVTSRDADDPRGQPRRAITMDIHWRVPEPTGAMTPEGKPLWLDRNQIFYANEGDRVFEFFLDELPDVTISYSSKISWASQTKWLTIPRLLFMIAYFAVVFGSYFAG